MGDKKQIPVYSLDKFRSADKKRYLFQIELFDANRHFEVSYPHRHDFYEVLFLRNGSGYHIIDENKYQIKPPCIFFMSPGQTHKLELSHDIDGYIFLFDAGFYLSNQKNKNRLLEFPFFFSVEQNNPPLYLSHKTDVDFLEMLFKKGCAELEKGEECSVELIRSILDLILLNLDQLYPEELRSIESGKGHILVKNFLRLIEENYERNLRVSDYASMLAVTPNHLTQMVKEITGKSSIMLIQEKLVAEVKRLILHTNLNISEIAELMSFTDQSYFTKYFKKISGISPIQYRKESMKST